jgi:hypothetical protein
MALKKKTDLSVNWHLLIPLFYRACHFKVRQWFFTTLPGECDKK